MQKRLIFYKSFQMRLSASCFSKTLSKEAVSRRSSVKKLLLKISQNSQENICARASLLMKWQAETCSFIKKKALRQVPSYEFCKTTSLSKSNFPFIRDNNNNNKNSKWRQLRRPGVVTVNFEQISQIVLVFSLLTLNK